MPQQTTETERRVWEQRISTMPRVEFGAKYPIESPLIIKPEDLYGVDTLAILQFGLILKQDGTLANGRVHSKQRPFNNNPGITNGAFEAGSGADRRLAANKAQYIGLLNTGNYDTIIPSGRDVVRVKGTNGSIQDIEVDWSRTMYDELVAKGYKGPFIHDPFTRSSHNTHEENSVLLGLASPFRDYQKRDIAVLIDRRQVMRWAADFLLHTMEPDVLTDFTIKRYYDTMELLTNDYFWRPYRDQKGVEELAYYINGASFLSEDQRFEQLLMLKVLQIISNDSQHFFQVDTEQLHYLAQQFRYNTRKIWNHNMVSDDEITSIPVDTNIRAVLAEDIFRLGPVPTVYMEDQLRFRKSIQRTTVLNDGGAVNMLLFGIQYADKQTRIQTMMDFISSGGDITPLRR